MRTHWVHDYETLSNCFVGVFEDTHSSKTKVFVIHDLINDLADFLEFLKNNIDNDEWHISFNGLAFDAQITEYIIKNSESLLEMSGCEAASWIYSKAQYIIETKNAGNFLDFYEKTMSIHQIDLFKLNHWDNPAKRSSLKWIQFSMDWNNVMDMPIHHTSMIKTLEEIENIIKYCKNDVSSTKQIMMLSKKQIALRKTLTDEYNIPLFSASEPRVSKELFLHFLSKKTGIKKYELKELRTKRDKVIVKDILLDYIKFESATFQRLHNKYKELVVYPDQTKGGFKYSIQYKGVKTDFGLGGLHGAAKKGIYESNKDMIIMSSDVTSFYPNLAIRNGWAPAHLPKDEFCEQYEWFFNERRKISKKDIRNYVYKIILNSTYGLSNDRHSFLYDPEFTMKITINGQLSLCMLYEMIAENIPESIPIMQNTDGLETLIPRKEQSKYLEICEKWQMITNLELEHDTYSKIILADVNNYIAVYDYKEIDKETFLALKEENPHNLFKEEDGKFFYGATKCNGMRFDFHNLALHKNKSFLIIRKTLFNYFIHGLDPKEYIKSQSNIFDFCGGVKVKGDWKYVEEYIEDGEFKTSDLQSTVRYYISNKGSKLMKINKVDKRRNQVEAGKWLQTPFINFIKKDFHEYDINYDFYLEKVNKIKESLEPSLTQLKLNF